MLPGVAFLMLVFFWAAGAAAYTVETTGTTLYMPFPLDEKSPYELHLVGTIGAYTTYYVAQPLPELVNASATVNQNSTYPTKTKKEPPVVATLTVSYARAILETKDRKASCHWFGGIGAIATCVDEDLSDNPQPQSTFRTRVMAVRTRVVRPVWHAYVLHLISPYILVPVGIMITGFAIIWSCGGGYQDATPAYYYSNPW